MFSLFFINRPKFAFVISILMMLSGLICINLIPIAEYPEVTPPVVSVRASYEGASPEELAQVVASPIEEQLIGLEDLQYFNSSSTSDGSYSLTLTFLPGANDDMAQVNASNAVGRAEPRLPSEIKQTGIQVDKRTSDTIFFGAFSCDENKMSSLELYNWVRMNVKDRVASINGVSGVDLRPDQNYSMRIFFNVTRMSALNITPQDIRNAIAAQNIQAAAGSVGTEDSKAFATFKVTAKGRLHTVEEFENIIIKHGEGGHITRIKDVATVNLGAEKIMGNFRVNGGNVVLMMASRNADANALSTVEKIRETIEVIKPTFPEGMVFLAPYDPTKAIEATMQEIILTLGLALGLVAFVTFVFLQDWRAAIIPILAIPVSLLGSLVFLYALGYSINILTMFGLILVIGSLVDDAIVVVENVIRIMHDEGLNAKEATIKSMKQITGAVLATTLVTLAVYVPIAFYGGMVGIIYTQFSVTMCIALCLSTFNALTLSPALCALLLRPAPEKEGLAHRIVFGLFNFVLNLFRRFYLGGCRLLVNNAWLTVLIFLGIVAGNVTYLQGIPKALSYLGVELPEPSAEEKAKMKAKMQNAPPKVEPTANFTALITPFRGLSSSFIPTEDKGSLFIQIDLEGSATVAQRTDMVMREIEARLKSIDEIASVTSMSGFSFMAGVGEGKGMLIINLKPWNERPDSSQHVLAIQREIDKLIVDIPEAKVRTMVPPAIMGMGLASGISMVLQAQGDATPKNLSDTVKEFTARLSAHRDKIAAVICNYDAETPQIQLDINREKAQSLGIPVNSIFSTLQSVLASSYVNDFTLNNFTFKVKIQGNTQDRRTANDILNVLVRNEKGEMVPLSAVFKLSYRMGPATYTRFNQLMSADMMVIPIPGTSSGDAMDLIEETLAEINKEERAAGLDRQWLASWKDMTYQERQNEGKLTYLLLAAIVFAYLFLVAQYESWTTPMPVIFSVSVATLGALMGAQLFGLSLSIYVQLGILMLIGLASKNAILIVEFCKEDHELHGTKIQQAALNGAKQRFRAVLMTAISFLCGVYPMVIATGAGATSRQEIGITTFAGMLLATVWGIFMVPALYSIFARMRDATARVLGYKTPTPENHK